MEGFVSKYVDIHVEIQDRGISQEMEIFQYMEIFQDMEMILDMEAKHHTLLHHITIGKRKQLCCRSYKLYAYALN